MRYKKTKIISGIGIVLALAGFLLWNFSRPQSSDEITKEIKPAVGSIHIIISASGTVLPKNRLEVKPPVNGRVDEVLVQEGETVKAGQTLAWMSSTERAALLDAARGQGQETVIYWKEVYKAIPLISPINGEVIVATTQPGQTVTTNDAVIVLSDQLITRAQVDETDIGKIKQGQEAEVTLDAYPDEKIRAKVEHIYYESKTVNNVTIYEVDLLPENVPSFFRSGMNATINFIVNSKENVLLIPAEAVLQEGQRAYVLTKEGSNGQHLRREVKLGITDDKNFEIISGLNSDDTVLVRSKRYALPKSTSTSNPFMPSRPRR